MNIDAQGVSKPLAEGVSKPLVDSTKPETAAGRPAACPDPAATECNSLPGFLSWGSVALQYDT